MKVTFNQHIGIFENAISNEWCDKVINYFEDNIKYAEPRNKQGGSLSGIRDTQYNLDNKNLIDEFTKNFLEVLNLYSYKYNHFPQPLDVIGFKIQKTLPTEGYHVYHVEQGVAPPSLYRIGVYSVYLNDVEEGGETEFLYQLKRIKPKKGTICIFPSGYTHVHRGNTPFSGTKYIMTGWLSLPIDYSNGSKLRNR